MTNETKWYDETNVFATILVASLIAGLFIRLGWEGPVAGFATWTIAILVMLGAWRLYTKIFRHKSGSGPRAMPGDGDRTLH